MTAAVFLDRDGVLIEERDDFVVDASRLRILDGVAAGLGKLGRAGFALAVVTNQPVVARGIIDEAQLGRIHQSLLDQLVALGAPRLDGVWFCPHHPQATLDRYRLECDCRKPKAGMLRRAAAALNIDLSSSWMIGDRPSDIAAGRAAGCQTILLECGRHLDPPIVGAENLGATAIPHRRARTLLHASEIILGSPK